MLTKKVIVFNKLLKFSFFYRVQKKNIEVDLVGRHDNCLFFDLDKVLYFILRLIPFFFNLIKQQGCLVFIGINFVLLKWFQKQKFNRQEEFILDWKAGIITNFFKRKLDSSKLVESDLIKLPLSFFFFKLDNFYGAFKEISKLQLPILGFFENTLNPVLIYSIGGWKMSFFINCFFFKLLSKILNKIH